MEEGKDLGNMCTESAQQRFSKQSRAKARTQQGRMEPKVRDLVWDLEG